MAASHRLDKDTFRIPNNATVIGSREQREKYPLQDHESSDESDDEASNECPSCMKVFVSLPAKEKHVDIYVNKNHMRWIKSSEYSDNQALRIVCPVNTCCEGFNQVKLYRLHITEFHNGSASKNIPIYQDPQSIASSDHAVCPNCRDLFSRKDALVRHIKNCVGRQVFSCEHCNKFNSHSYSEILEHARSTHQTTDDFVELNDFRLDNNMPVLPGALTNDYLLERTRVRKLQSVHKVYSKIFAEEYTSLDKVLTKRNKKKIIKKIKYEVALNKRVNVQLVIPLICTKEEGDKVEECTKYIRTRQITVEMDSDLSYVVNKSYEGLEGQTETLELEGSGWSIGM
jgi:hypothetical protein